MAWFGARPGGETAFHFRLDALEWAVRRGAKGARGFACG